MSNTNWKLYYCTVHSEDSTNGNRSIGGNYNSHLEKLPAVENGDFQNMVFFTALFLTPILIH